MLIAVFWRNSLIVTPVYFGFPQSFHIIAEITYNEQNMIYPSTFVTIQHSILISYTLRSWLQYVCSLFKDAVTNKLGNIGLSGNSKQSTRCNMYWVS